jgi:hypothetical protein
MEGGRIRLADRAQALLESAEVGRLYLGSRGAT